MSAGALPDGTRGFDANGTLDTATAMYAASHGYAFAVRYIRRARVNPHDVTSGEVATILEAGLALMLVQHVASENAWTPSADLGRRYGAIAANECRRVGL